MLFGCFVEELRSLYEEADAILFCVFVFLISQFHRGVTVIDFEGWRINCGLLLCRSKLLSLLLDTCGGNGTTTGGVGAGAVPAIEPLFFTGCGDLRAPAPAAQPPSFGGGGIGGGGISTSDADGGGTGGGVDGITRAEAGAEAEAEAGGRGVGRALCGGCPGVGRAL